MVTIPTIPNHDTIGIYSGGVSTLPAALPGYQFLVWPSDGAAARWPSDNRRIQVSSNPYPD